jgi:Na+-driven multidrug efflux pump
MLYFGYSIFRAQGETLLPGKVMVLTSIINVILDPLFIFYFNMGLAGAAWATCVAFLVGCAIIYYQISIQHLARIPVQVSIISRGLKQLFVFTSSSMTSQFIPPVSAMFATIIVASHGELVVAAWGLGSRIELLSIIVILALTMALPPIVGRLRGSKEIGQIHQLVKTSIGFVLVFQLLVAAILAISAIPVSQIFTDDQLVADTFSLYLWIVPLSYGALGVCMIMVSVCSAIGMPNKSIVISIIRLFVCYLPCLWIGSNLAGTNGLFVGVLIGNVLAGYLSWLIYKKIISSLLEKYNS